MQFGNLKLSQYIELSNLDKDKSIDELDRIVKKMAIVSGKSIEQVEVMDINYIKEKISFLNNVPQSLPFKKRLRIGFKVYKPTLTLQDIQVNQLVDFYALYKAEAPLNDLLAVIYKCGKYDSKNHAYLSAKMLNQKIKNVLGVVFFSLSYYNKCEKTINQYLEKSSKQVEMLMKEIQTDKEFQDFLSSGGGSIT